jgi:AraC-like DNA-binding protein
VSGPKTWLGSFGFQGALRAARAHVEIALAAGYYDRSHLISDFRALAGTTPGSLLREAESELAP